MLYFLLNIVDLLLSLYGQAVGIRELNPWFTPTGKILFTIVSTTVFIIFRKRKITKISVTVLGMLLTIILIWNLHVIRSLT